MDYYFAMEEKYESDFLDFLGHYVHAGKRVLCRATADERYIELSVELHCQTINRYNFRFDDNQRLVRTIEE